MAIGIVSDEELERELANSQSISVSAEIRTIKKGRGSGTVNVPSSVRKVIGEEAITHGHASGKILANLLGVKSESSVSAYQKGATSTALMDRPDPDLLDHVNEARQKVTTAAREKLTLAIDAITKEKLNDASPRVAAGVAKDMSAVVKNMEPSDSERGNSTKFVFFVPPMKTEEQFEVIDVKE